MRNLVLGLLISILTVFLPIELYTAELKSEGVLYGAIRELDATKVERLLDSGIDANLKNTAGQTPLIAVVDSFGLVTDPAKVATLIQIAKLLLNKGARVNDADKYGYTPLMLASGIAEPTEKDLSFIKLLLDYGADPDQDKDGDKALDFAKSESTKQTIRNELEKRKKIIKQEMQELPPELQNIIRQLGQF